MTATTLASPQDIARANPLALKLWRSSIPWFLGAVAFACFADGRYSLPIAAWLFPAFMLRFVRLQRPMRGLAITYVTLVVTRWFVFRGMIPLPGVFYLVFAAISSLSALAPYLLDRLLAPRLKGVANALVFPAALVATQFIYEQGPFGSWGSVAYTQAGNLALMQILAVTGLTGVTFLIGWFAGTFNLGASQLFGQAPAWRGLAISSFVVLAVVAAGEARLNLAPPPAQTVRVASLSPIGESIDTGGALFLDIASGKATAAERARFSAITTATRMQLFSRTASEAAAGAKLVFWSEEAALVLKPDEADLVAQGRALAARQHIYLGMTMGSVKPGASHPVENKIVLITPTGKVAWQYLKARPTPGPEAALLAPSAGRLSSLDTPYGRLTAAICYDTDFPALMVQAGRLHADLVLSPANDFRDVDPRHTQIAQFRAIEQGANLVRQSSHGLSAAYDYEGRPLAVMDAFHSPDQTLVAQVPVKDTSTLYTRLGDWLAWASIALLFGLIAVSLLTGRKKVRGSADGSKAGA